MAARGCNSKTCKQVLAVPQAARTSTEGLSKPIRQEKRETGYYGPWLQQMHVHPIDKKVTTKG